MKILNRAQATLAAAEARMHSQKLPSRKQNDKKNNLFHCRARLERAVKLMGGLGRERTRWTQSCADLTVSNT